MQLSRKNEGNLSKVTELLDCSGAAEDWRDPPHAHAEPQEPENFLHGGLHPSLHPSLHPARRQLQQQVEVAAAVAVVAGGSPGHASFL